MTITITRNKFALSVLVAVLIGTGIAGAQTDNDNPFTDVPDVGASDEAFFSAPVEWLWDNELTTGSPAGSNTFKPFDGVTRGEYATFNFRYDTNVVQPALEALQTEVDAAEADIEAVESNVATVAADVNNATRVYFAQVQADGTVEQTSTTELTVAKTGTGLYEVTLPENATNCTVQATTHYLAEGVGGLAELGLAFEHGNVVTFHNSADTNPVDEIDVVTYSGDPGVATDMDFSFTAFCSDPEFVIFNPGILIPPIITLPGS